MRPNEGQAILLSPERDSAEDASVVHSELSRRRTSTRASRGQSTEDLATNGLHKAAVTGDLAAVLEFIKSGGDIEAESFCGRTALAYASFHKHPDIVRALLLAGAEVNNKGGGKSSPLFFAAWGGSRRVVKLLLEYGAATSAKDAEGKSPISYSDDAAIKKMFRDVEQGVLGPSKLAGVSLRLVTASLACEPLLAFACVAAASGMFIMAAAAHGGAAAMFQAATDNIERGFVWALVAILAMLIAALDITRRLACLEVKYWSCLRERDLEILRLRRRLVVAGEGARPRSSQSRQQTPALALAQ